MTDLTLLYSFPVIQTQHFTMPTIQEALGENLSQDFTNITQSSLILSYLL